jgi:FkbM family methyltransferase
VSLYHRLRFLLRARRYRTRHDAAEIAFLRSVLGPGDTAIDIGAHKGGYTYWMARSVGARGRVFSFEPQPALAVALRANLEALKLGQVTVEQVALSGAAGRATLHVPGDTPSPGATLEAHASSGDARKLAVKLDTLDNYLAEHRPEHRHGSVRFIKCDVEGHELDVFRGAERTLVEEGPALLFECEARHHADGRIQPVFDFLTALGYRGSFFLGDELRPLDTFDPSRQQVIGREPYVNNFVFTRDAVPRPRP